MTHAAARQATANAVLAAALASVVAWFGPPGTDLAAHVYQLDVFARHGFELWTNYWYAGRYTFVGYSLTYYPLAALIGIKLLAVLSAATATAAFTLVVRETWGEQTVFATRLFAVVTAASVVTAAFPYGLGLSFSLAALVALGRWRLGWFALFVVLTVATSPLAFLFLLLVLVSVGASRVDRAITKPALVVAVTCMAAALLWRLFPDGGRFPFASSELVAALTFAGGGVVMTWRVEKARILRALFAAYGVLCVVAYLVPSDIGSNVARLRFAAIPITALALSLRRWRPWPVAAVAFGLACSWNITPLAWSVARSSSDPSASAAYWQPAISFLHRSLAPGYRVEAVDTTGHWEAVYLARAGIPIVRGWFRQDDFPQNELLYDPLGSRSYLQWLHWLGVRYVVLTKAPEDYSAHSEAELLRSGRSGLRVVFRSANSTIFAVPNPVPIVRGPDNPRVVGLTQTQIDVAVNAPGTYRVEVRYSPYLAAEGACTSKLKDGMTQLDVAQPGRIKLAFAVTPGRAFDALAGIDSSCQKAG
ncbi:MAG TPA: hypothetical protein VGL76_06405 [Gaiellaceae bacterium]|jgi:hypothetical protein